MANDPKYQAIRRKIRPFETIQPKYFYRLTIQQIQVLVRSFNDNASYKRQGKSFFQLFAVSAKRSLNEALIILSRSYIFALVPWYEKKCKLWLDRTGEENEKRNKKQDIWYVLDIEPVIDHRVGFSIKA